VVAYFIGHSTSWLLDLLVCVDRVPVMGNQ